jgi:hypothetical protein
MMWFSNMASKLELSNNYSQISWTTLVQTCPKVIIEQVILGRKKIITRFQVGTPVLLIDGTYKRTKFTQFFGNIDTVLIVRCNKGRH